MNYDPKTLKQFHEQIEASEHILIMQAEHIDADSLGSSMGLEAALGSLGKKITLYCHDDVPTYLRHIPGWDRVTHELPNAFDMAILVDSSTTNQLERTWSKHKDALLRRPFYCIDHHMSENAQIEGDNVVLLIDTTAGASSQQVSELARHFDWEIDAEAAYALASGIKADTVNLSTKHTTAQTFEAMAYLVERGADLEALRSAIEQTSSIPAEQLPIRARVLARTQFHHDNRIAITYFTQEEYEILAEDKLLIERTKHELRTIKEVDISVIITERKGYANASMRANIDIARLTAEHFDGGGHDRAASCRFSDADHEAVTEQIVPVLIEKMKEYDERDSAI